MRIDNRLIAVILSVSAVLAGPSSAQTTPQYTLTILGLVQHNYITSVFAPLSVNDNDVVAGYAKVKVPHNPQQSFRGVEWQNSSPHYTILGTISEDPGQDSEATWINNLGVAVGFSNEHLGSNLYSAHPVMFTANGIVNLGVKSAKEGFATGINNASQVVGYLNFETPVPASEAFLYQNGVMTMLGYPVPTIGHSMANAINNNGLIVGSATFSTGANPHAASYANGVWTDLGTPGSGTNYKSSASSVNDSGAIVGLWT
ncbi:MAG: hypothetical protein JOZ08_03010, partial [Verrucomicrobia bacterium]|nr:hypothetical protein [Verrucomicrobiota bacterium]